MTQHSKDRPAPPTRDEGERISLSDINELDAEEIQVVRAHSSAPPPPPKEAIEHVVVPRLAPLSSDSLRPPRVPDSEPEADPEMEITETPRRKPRAKKQEDEGDDRDVVDIRWVLAAAVLLAVVIGTWTLARRGEPPLATTPAADPERVALTLTGLPSGARVELDGRPVSGPEVMVRGGVRHAVEVHSDGHETWRQVFITRGGLELVVSLAPSTESTPTTGADPAAAVTPPVEPVVDAPPLGEAPPEDEPPVAEEPSTRPRTTSTSTTSTSTMTVSTTTMSTAPTMAATMRSTHTLVRDPGF